MSGKFPTHKLRKIRTVGSPSYCRTQRGGGGEIVAWCINYKVVDTEAAGMCIRQMK